MKVGYPKPSDKVSEFVQDILIIENFQVTTPFTLPLFANGKPTLLFQTAKGQIQNSTNHLTLFGQTLFPDTLTIKDNFTLIAYFFKPYALPILFGIKAKELTDKPINLNLLSPTITQSLQEQLLNAHTIYEMLALIDHYIYKLITKIKCDIKILQYATSKISAKPVKDILVETQEELAMTERTFQRLFANHIGISPNQYRRIVQFDAAFKQLNKREFRQLSDIAFDNNYADQSHFIRTFKEFTNLVPKEYLEHGSLD